MCVYLYDIKGLYLVVAQMLCLFVAAVLKLLE